MNTLNVKPKKEKRKSWYYRMSFEHKTAMWGVIFLLPWLLGFFLLFLTPMVEMVIYSFNEVKIIPTGGVSKVFKEFENYRQALLVDANFLPSVIETVLETVLFTPLIIVFSLLCM